MAAGAPVPFCTFQSLSSLLYVNDGSMWWFQNIWSCRLGSIFSFWEKVLIMSCPIFCFFVPCSFYLFFSSVPPFAHSFSRMTEKMKPPHNFVMSQTNTPMFPDESNYLSLEGESPTSWLRPDLKRKKIDRRHKTLYLIVFYVIFMLLRLFSAPYWNMLYERVATKALLLHQWWIMSQKF